MLDAAMTIAAYAKVRQWLPTVEMKSSFLEPVPIGRCIGEGRVLKAGRKLAFVEGRLLGASGQPAIVVTATLLVPEA
jgi:acyl-coenzyme A thioesterase PaaI-like protein